MNADIKEPLHILASIGGNFFEHRAFLADHNALVAFTLAVMVASTSINPLFPARAFFNAYRDAVWNFLIKQAQQLFPDDLRCNYALRLIGQRIVREKCIEGVESFFSSASKSVTPSPLRAETGTTAVKS